MIKITSKLLIMISLLLSFSFVRTNAAETGKSEFRQQDVSDIITKGVVKDQSGEPLVGLTVKVIGTTNGTITDLDGLFSLECKQGDVLLFSFIGFKDLEVEARKDFFHEILMDDDYESLDEMVVIGYGTTTRKHIIGAVDKVGSELIKDRPVANLSQALQGISPSLTIQQKSMNPNDNSMNINIRGVSSMNNNDPLIVIDGMISNDVQAMNRLNPSDIENISILKDAGTAAIYGSRSANGVILITTKKGKKNMEPVVSFSATIGTQNPKILLTPIEGYQNALLRNDSYVNSGLDPLYSSEEIRAFGEGDSEWGYNAIMKNATQQNYNVGVQGGSEFTSYNLSFAYFDQESNYKGQDFGVKKYNLRSNIVADIGRLTLSTILAYNRSEGRSDRGGLWLSDVMRVPTYNSYDIYPDEDGKYYNNAITTGGNYLASLYHGGLTKNDNDHFQGIISGELKIFNGLTAKAVLGYDLSADHRFIDRKWYPVYNYINRDVVVNAADSKNYSMEDYNSKSTMMNTQFLLNYNRKFGEHNVTGLMGYTSESYRRKANEIKRNYVDPDLGLDTDETVYSTGSYNTPQGFTERGLHSWLGRLGYSFADKYYSEISARYDGSSKFAEGNRWGFFPSATLGWRISEESFMESYKENVGDFKIRGSYGLLGSQSVDDYQFLTTYNIYTDQYGFNNSSVTGTGYTFGNESLSWEKTKTFNIGFDAMCFENLRVNFDFFNKYTTDILLTPQTPGTLGGAVPKANQGEMQNQGWELSLNYTLRKSDFVHSFGFNIGDTYNKVTKYGDQDIFASDEVERIIREGVPLYSYYGFKTDGLYQNQDDVRNSATFIGADLAPGDVKYVDRNEDGIIDDNDRYILGNAFPRYNYGFTYNVTWKNFDFNMLWQGVGKRDMALRGEMIEPYHASYYYVMFEHQLDYWSPANTDAKYPRLLNNSASSSYNNNYGHGSDRNIYDASYLRLKQLQIGYTLPKHMINVLGIEKTRLYFTGQNLLTFTANKFIDPESSEFGNSMNANGANSGRNYPTLMYFGGGIDIEF